MNSWGENTGSYGHCLIKKGALEFKIYDIFVPEKDQVMWGLMTTIGFLVKTKALWLNPYGWIWYGALQKCVAP